MIADPHLHDQQGREDNFLKHFKEDIMTLHEKIGVPIVGSWVNVPQIEFICVSTYKDKAEIEAKTKELQAAVAAAGRNLQATSRRWECVRSNRRCIEPLMWCGRLAR